MLKARLHPDWAGGKAGYLYSVVFDGQLLVERSHDSQFDVPGDVLSLVVAFMSAQPWPSLSSTGS
jgi:hypothetical protein